MRTLDPVLQAAMNSGNFSPIVRACVLDGSDHSIAGYLDLVYYKINGIDLEIEFYDQSNSFTDVICLERGAKIGDTEYTIFSGIYHLVSSYKIKGGLYVCAGSLIEPQSVSLPGDVTYHEVILSVLGLGENRATFQDPAADWLAYQFLPPGKSFHSNNIYSFLSLLKQKYMIHVTENGLEAAPLDNSLLFFCAADVINTASLYTIALNANDTWSIKSEYRQFIWRDELGIEHAPGPAGYAIHNLGYLESGNDPPSIPGNVLSVAETCVTIIPNLKYQTGDCMKFDPGIAGFTPVKSILDVTEIFNAKPTGHKGPAWYMELRPLAYFANTAGGTVPTSSQYTAAYNQLVTEGFNGILTPSVDSLQILADTIDDYSPVKNGDIPPVGAIAGKAIYFNTDGDDTYIWGDSAWHKMGKGSGDVLGSGGIVGRVAEFVTNTKTIQAAKLIAPTDNVLTLKAIAAATLQAAITAGKMLTLTAADDYNVTFPGTGTIAMLELGNVFTAEQSVTLTDHSAEAWSVSGRTVHHAHAIPPHATIAVGNLYDVYTYAGDGTSTQLMNTFLRTYTVAGESAVAQIGGLYTALYHTAGYTLPEWRGIETGTAYADGASSIITLASGLTVGLPICLNGGSVTTAAGIYIPARGDTTGLGTIYSVYSRLLQPSYWKGTFQVEDATFPVDAWRTGGQASMRFTAYVDSTANGGIIQLRGARGTYSVPDNIGSADEIGNIRWYGYTTDGTPGFREMGRIVTLTNGATSSTSYASKMQFRTVPTGATGLWTGLSLYDGMLELAGVTNADGGVFRIARYQSTVLANYQIGKLEFWNNDFTLTTQNIYANIVVTSSQAITTNAAAGTMVFNVTGTGLAGSPIEHMRFSPSTVAQIGVFGHAVAPQQIGCAEPTDLPTAITAIKALRTALNAYGWTTVV